MNKIKTSLFILSLIFGMTAFAQQEAEWCGTDIMLQEYFDINPAAELEFRKSSASTPEMQAKREKANGKYIIPVVVHVMHANGVGNISKAQIEDGIRILNEDFSKMNSDTTNVRNEFKSLIADAEVEFRLAKIDPNGNCTEGITRNNSLTTNSPDNRNAPKYIVQWDPYKYLNVWLVNSINSGTGQGRIGGFAQFPNPGGGPANTFGLVVRHDEWGYIGTASNSTFGGRAPTHEVGHCFWLYHPFQDGCGNDCSSSGDFVCDTPPQESSNNNSCSHSFNTCNNDANGGNPQNPNPYTSNVPDQIENFMGYGIKCQVMFTKGQRKRMHDALNQFDILKTLHTEANLIATGTNDSYSAAPCLPKLTVTDQFKFACIDDSITFSEQSWGGVIDSYNWRFPGGSPSTSTLANPSIAYSEAGTYDVILTVSNARGSDSLVLKDYVIISPDTGYSAIEYYETFEKPARFEEDWQVIKYASGAFWNISTFAAKGGSQSLWLNNWGNKDIPGAVNAVISPALDFTPLSNPEIYFDVAYKKREVLSSDRLRVYLSDDCSSTWDLIVMLDVGDLAVDLIPMEGQFLPEANDWKQITITSDKIPAKYKTMTNVKIKIELESGGGNNIYIDNFRLDNTLTGVTNVQAKEDLSKITVYPNPAKENVMIKVENSKENEYASIYLTDILGKRVASVYEGQMTQSTYTFNVDLSSYPAGIYFVTVQNATARKTQKLIVK